MEASVKVETVLLVLCTSWTLSGALQLELASVVSVGLAWAGTGAGLWGSLACFVPSCRPHPKDWESGLCHLQWFETVTSSH